MEYESVLPEPLPYNTPPQSFTIEEARWIAQALLDEAVEPRIIDISSIVWDSAGDCDCDCDSTTAETRCGVCLMDEEETRHLHSSCTGSMCRECVDLWFCSKNTCPFCRHCLEN